MPTILEGETTDASGRFAVAVAQFNADITEALLEGCLHAFERAGVGDDAVTVTRVPGAFELPATCDRLAASGKFEAVVALGAVIRGDTPHFDYVAGECARGLMQVSLERAIPVVFGVLTTDTLEQARHRADRRILRGSAAPSGAERDAKSAPLSNKGAEAAEVALQMTSLFRKI